MTVFTSSFNKTVKGSLFETSNSKIQIPNGLRKLRQVLYIVKKVIVFPAPRDVTNQTLPGWE